MDPDLVNYVIKNYGGLMAETERLAWEHLRLSSLNATNASRGGRGSFELSDDPDVLRLAAGGLDAFLARTAERILRDHPGDVFLNCCPKCNGIGLTPRAKQCPHCYHSWHHEPNVRP